MSLPTPPSGILDRDQPWYRGKVSDAQFDRLKAKLTGGRDASGTSYSKFIDCSPEEADKIISNMKKDPRGYPQMHMPGGGEAYQVMIDYYEFLKSAYLYDEPKAEPENIPVEVEVVEVEQKTVDEPIVIKVEAPFESTPQQPLSAPKTLKLPRRSGIVRLPIQTKKSAAERMAEAFDGHLDDLVESIQNPPESAQPKQRKQTESLVKIRKSVKPTDFKGTKGPGFFQNSSLFVFNKTKDAFGRAAALRKQAAEQGMPEQKKRFYFNKALGHEFGGDAIARTRGTFSSSPDATLDPALTKQQRLSEGIFGTRTIRQPKQESGVANDIQKQVDELEKKFDDVIDTKKITPESAQLEKTLADLRDKLSANNKLQKGINDSKKKLLGLEAKAADAAQARAEEAEMDAGEDLSSFEDVEAAEGKKDGKKGGKQGDGLDIGDIFDRFRKFKKSKWWRRLKNPKQFGRTLFRYGRRFLWQPVKAAATKVGAALTGTAATTAAIVGGVGLAASGLGEGFFQLTKKGGAGEKTRDFLKKKGEEMGGPMGALVGGVGNLAGISNEATKVTGNILDVVGSPFRYAIEAVRYPFLNEEDRKKQAENLAKFDARIRENIRGGLNRIDFMNVVPDEKGGFGNIYGNDDAQKEMMEKMSEGGVIPKFTEVSGARLSGDLGGGTVDAMIGEAGPELLLRDGQQPAAPDVNPLQSLAPIIVAMREVTKRAGTWADPVENMIRQITDPIAKSLNLPVLPMNVDIDKDTDETKTKKISRKGGLLGKIMNFLRGGSSEDEEVEDVGEDGVDIGNAGNFSGGAKGVLDLIASVESPDYDTFNQSRGRTEGKATEKTIQWLHDNAQGAIGRYQHMPEFILDRAQRYGIPTNALFTPEVQDLMTIRMMEEQHGLKEFLSGELSAEEFGARLAATWRGLPQGPKNAARLGGSADSTYNDGTDNHAGMKWADAVASLKSIQGGGSSSPASPDGSGGQVRAVGDSLAEGVATVSEASDNATQGHNPAQVLNTLKNDVSRGNTSRVVLSTGLSNNVSMLRQAERQMAYLDRQGIPTTVLPVSDKISDANGDLNAKIQAMTEKYSNVSYASNVEGFSTNDGVHPSSYVKVMTQVRLARN